MLRCEQGISGLIELRADLHYLRVVNENIDATEVVDGSLDDLITIFDRVVVGDGSTTSLANLLDNGVRGLRGGTRT